MLGEVGELLFFGFNAHNMREVILVPSESHQRGETARESIDSGDFSDFTQPWEPNPGMITSTKKPMLLEVSFLLKMLADGSAQVRRQGDSAGLGCHASVL